MSRGKIIDLDPRTRLSKEAIDRFKKTIASLKYEDTDAMLFIHIPKEGEFTFQAFNLSWELAGRASAMIRNLEDMMFESELVSESEGFDEDPV